MTENDKSIHRRSNTCDANLQQCSYSERMSEDAAEHAVKMEQGRRPRDGGPDPSARGRGRFTDLRPI